MTTLSTHDTKRSEDVRARLVLLSEDARRWERAVTRLLTLANKYTGPGRAGAARRSTWSCRRSSARIPISDERLGAYLAKAVREAKLHTSWTAPDEAYEAAVQAYVAGVLADRAIMTAVEEYVARARSSRAGSTRSP